MGTGHGLAQTLTGQRRCSGEYMSLLVKSLAIIFLTLMITPRPGNSLGFRAGAHAELITPEQLPSPINGSMRGGFASSVHDPMFARSLALHDGRHELIFCVIDSCMVPREICDETRRIVSEVIGVPASSLLISATHTHTAATMTSVFQSDPDPKYVATLPARIAKSMVQAHRNLEPAEIAWGRGTEPALLFNRRWLMREGQTYVNPFGGIADRARMNPGHQNPEVSKPIGPVDPEIFLIATRAVSDQRPIALLANYGLHYVGGSPAISADYFGAFATEITSLLNASDGRYHRRPPFVGIMSNGTSGDVNNVNYAEPQPPPRKPGEQISHVARRVATEVKRVYLTLGFRRSVELRSVEADITLGVRKPTTSELASARELIAQAKRDTNGQLLDQPAIYARESLLLDEYPDRVSLRLQAHRIGNLSLAAIPCEVFTRIGLDLKRVTPFTSHFTVSLANGYNGYLPTPEDHRLGGYETWRARSSYLEVDASTIITAELKRMMEKLK